MVPLVADQHELAGLIGGDQQRCPQLPQERGEVRRVDGAQGRVFLRGKARLRPLAGICAERANDMRASVLLARLRRQVWAHGGLYDSVSSRRNARNWLAGPRRAM